MSMTEATRGDRYLTAIAHYDSHKNKYESHKSEYAKVELGRAAIRSLQIGENVQDKKLLGGFFNPHKSALIANFIERAAAIREISSLDPSLLPRDYAENLIEDLRAHLTDDAKLLLTTEISHAKDGSGPFTYTAKIDGRPWITISDIPEDDSLLSGQSSDGRDGGTREPQSSLSVNSGQFLHGELPDDDELFGILPSTGAAARDAAHRESLTAITKAVLLSYMPHSESPPSDEIDQKLTMLKPWLEGLKPVDRKQELYSLEKALNHSGGPRTGFATEVSKLLDRHGLRDKDGDEVPPPPPELSDLDDDLDGDLPPPPPPPPRGRSDSDDELDDDLPLPPTPPPPPSEHPNADMELTPLFVLTEQDLERMAKIPLPPPPTDD